MRKTTIEVSPTLLASTILLSFGACAPAENAQVDSDAEPAMEMAETTASTPVMPDTTVDAVWSHLEEENYDENWGFWPGREPFYSGTEPHGALLNTYLNDTAMHGLAAIRNQGATELPDGSIVVKENHMPDSTLAAVTVMYKVEGYDAEHNDWWWLKRLADGTVEAAGRAAPCVQCHSQATSHDYLVTAAQEAGG